MPTLAILCLGTAQTPGTAHAWRTAADLTEFADTERVRAATDEFRFEVSMQTAPLPVADVTAAALAAAATWSDVACSSLTIFFDGTTTGPAVAADGRNTVQWLDIQWRARGYPADAAGVTEVVYERAPSGAWVIAEADIYLNGHFAWAGPSDPTHVAERPDPRCCK